MTAQAVRTAARIQIYLLTYLHSETVAVYRIVELQNKLDSMSVESQQTNAGSCCYVLLNSKVKYTWICIARLRANASNALRYGSHSVTCKQHHICLYSPLQSITAVWPVLTAPTYGGSQAEFIMVVG